MYDDDEVFKEPSEEEKRKGKKRQNIIFIVGIVGAVILIAAAIGIAYAVRVAQEDKVTRKPVLYLYPEDVTNVSVKLDFDGLVVSYPEYKDGWNVTAYPDGTLIDDSGNEYSYLFWEADTDTQFDFSEGFCVKGSDTADFLRWALAEQGLTPREYNEFIVYWLPYMKDNPYNIISFQEQSYENSAPLNISPAPDSIKRVFMAYYPSDHEQIIPPQKLAGFERSGFTAVEWGGVCVDR